MKNIDRLSTDPIEDPEWIADDRNDANLRALGYARSGVRQTTDAINDFPEAALDGCRYRRIGVS